MQFTVLLLQITLAQLAFAAPAPIDKITGDIVKRAPGAWCVAQGCSMEHADRRDAEPVVEEVSVAVAEVPVVEEVPAVEVAKREPGAWCVAQGCSMEHADRRDAEPVVEEVPVAVAEVPVV
ncbi:hypothetical protein BDR26DRAFT_922618, partial [Obelidium mucronatum]